MIDDSLHMLDKIIARSRGLLYKALLTKSFKKVGRNFKFYGGHYIQVGKDCCMGDNCWVQAVYKYKTKAFLPEIKLGDRLMCSDSVHISSVSKIIIGSDTLIGSNVYIGDHSHGSTRVGEINIDIAPSERDLADVGDIYIGNKVWLCDGVVVLAGTYLASGSIVGANAVVKGQYREPSILAGVPAKIVRKL